MPGLPQPCNLNAALRIDLLDQTEADHYYEVIRQRIDGYINAEDDEI